LSWTTLELGSSSLSSLNDTGGWGWSSLSSHNTGDEGRRRGQHWCWVSSSVRDDTGVGLVVVIIIVMDDAGAGVEGGAIVDTGARWRQPLSSLSVVSVVTDGVLLTCYRCQHRCIEHTAGLEFRKHFEVL